MAASWSSAATGKPQLSYAERLRRAKEGTSKADLPIASAPPSYADAEVMSPNGRDHHEAPSRGKDPKRPPSTHSSISTLPHAVQKTPPTPNAKIESAGESHAPLVGSPTTTKTVVNVWDARKKLLQEREKAKAAEEVKASTSTVRGSQDAKIVQESVEEATKTSKQPTRSDPWLQKVQLLNGGVSSTKVDEKGDRSTKGEEVKGKKKKGTDGARGRNGSNAPPPSIADVAAWPSPDASMSTVAKSAADTGRRQDDERGADRGAGQPGSPLTNGLQGLDAQIGKQVGDSPKKGKQWAPIIPAITHTNTTSGTPAKRKPSKTPIESSSSTTSSALTTSTVEAKAAPVSPSTYTRRLEQKRPTPLPISTQVTSPMIGNEPTFLQSPTPDLRGLSPRLARMALSNQTMQSRSNSLVASPRRDYSSSPIRSPSLAGGSVRGPRFSGDLKSPKDAHSWLQPLPSDDTPLDFSLQYGIDASSSSRNALHLSDGYSDTPPQLSAGSSQAGTTDGSYAPIRAGANAFSPTSNQSIRQDLDPRRAISLHRTLSNAPSARGSRGRGKSSKVSDGHSVGESSSSRNDNEDRGLPSDVPSGPKKQQNGDGTPPREGGRGYNGGGSFRRVGPYYQHPMPPYGMYGAPPPPPPPPGSFFYSPTPPLESTPSELAPQGDPGKSEPSEALLHQIEFYFSHRNLEGDFYLRKNMDSQGFVPIQVVANFNKVKKMTENIDVIKETLLFSKVLTVDTERGLVRKAIDWHLYTLIDGERAQQNMYPPSQHPIPHFGSPPPPIPPYAPYYGHPAGLPPPPFYFASPYNQTGPPFAFSQGNPPPGPQYFLQRPADSGAEGQLSNGEGSSENVYGVIAAEGLAAEKRSRD